MKPREMTDSPKLMLVHTGVADWFAIDRADDDNLSDAMIEGTAHEMREIAKAIRVRGSAKFKRCAVLVATDGRVYFRSPRNSREYGETSLAEADALADLIEERLGKD